MVVTGVSHSCLLVELGQTVIIWQPHCDLRVVSITSYLTVIMEVYGKTITGLGPIHWFGTTYKFRFSNDVLNIKISLLTEKRIEKEIEVTFEFQQ